MSRRSLTLALAAALLCALLPGPGPAVAEQGESGVPAVADLQRRIAVGALHTCAILDSGAVRCWGGNDNGQLGNGGTATTTTPTLVAGLSAVVELSAGANHTCALLHGGAVRCWGLNGSGQLGDGTTDNRLTPVPVTGLDDASAIIAGGFHTCALRADGTVSCWGNDAAGQLGDGAPGDTSLVPVAVAGITAANPATAIAAGEFHTCALLADATVRCWGHNGFGQLGDGTTTDQAEPVAVAGLPAPADNPVLALATGSSHTCVLLDDTSLRCWGHNAYGQLGRKTALGADGVMSPSPTPLGVRHDTDPNPLTENLADLDGAVAITAGQFHSCALMDDGAGRCWGNNHRGQLGADPQPLTERLEDSPHALAVGGLSGAEALVAGGFHTCALAGGLRCWGYNYYGQLGAYRANNPSPVLVTAMSGATAVAAGTGFACALTAPGADNTSPPVGRPVCWGDNSDGRLGSGLPVPNTTVRVPVAGISEADALEGGNGHACAIPTGGDSPRCWGRNGNGQLGDGGTTGSAVPVAVSGLNNATRVSAGGAAALFTERGHSCARRDDGRAVCWGANSNGQIGDNTTAQRPTPTVVRIDTDPGPDVTLADLVNVVDVVAGGAHSCALIAGGTARCWGANGSGQLGDGTKTQRLTAVTVQGDTDPDADVPLTGITALVAGGHHTCARMSDSRVRCWGENGSGQLGDGSVVDRPLPTLMPSIPAANGVTRLTAGDFHTCASRTDGSLQCWGENGQGQLGNGGFGDSATPVYAFPVPHADANPFITGIAASRRNTCARLIDTSVHCWGDNAHGQLGDGIGPHSLAPLAVLGLGAVGTNAIPAPQDDLATTTPDTAVTVDVMANDSDPDGDPLTLVAVGTPPSGSVVDNGDGTLTVTPNAGFCGDQSFTYSVSDSVATVPATVTIAMNCPPLAANDAATTAEETAVTVDVLANDSDPDGDPLEVTAVSDPPGGTAAFSASDVTYTPDADVCDLTDAFSYTVSDGQGHSVSALVSVTVGCAADAPVAADDAAATAEDTPVVIDVLANDTDPDGDALVLGTVGAPLHGTAVADGQAVRYSPASGYCGPDSFTYHASDGVLTGSATVSVAVSCEGDSPQAVDDSATTAEDTPVAIDVLANDTDPDGEPLTLVAAGDPPHGSTSVGGGVVTYTPDPDFCGDDSFSVTISDGTLTGVSTVTVTVVCASDAPVAADDPATTDEDTRVHVHVLANDSDADGERLTVASVGDPAHGSAAGDGLGGLTYTPDPDYCGNDEVPYTAADPTGASDDGVVFVTVVCVNDAPQLTDVAAQSTRWGETLVLLLSAADADGDTLAFSLLGGADGATVSTDGLFSWTPGAHQVGDREVEVQVHDGAVADQGRFRVAVAPRATSLTYTGPDEGQQSDPVTLTAALTDVAADTPVAGRSVRFTLGGASATGVTDALGVAAVTLVPVEVGATTVRVAFEGDSAYESSGDEAAFTVAKEGITTTFTGRHLTVVNSSSATVPLSATVAEEPDGALGASLSTVRVSFRTLDGATLCSAMVSVTTPGQGNAACTTGTIGLGSHAVIVSANGAAYEGPADVAVFTVAQLGNGDAAGAGAVGDERFGFLAKAQRRAAPTGDAVHVFRAAATATVVRASSLGSLTTDCSGGKTKVCTTVVQAAGASSFGVDLLTGAVTPLAGTSSVRIDATDAGEPSGGSLPPDRYAVAITGATEHTLGAPDSQAAITAGNVRVLG